MGPLAACLVLLLAAAVSARQTDYCYAENIHPYLYFASKTAYEFIHPNNPTPENIPHCEPVQIWLLTRHGTRFPEIRSIEKMRNLTTLRDQIIRNHETGVRAGRLCNLDLDNLRGWQYNLTESQDSRLTSQGEEDMKFLARRLKQKFPSLLSEPYKTDLYQFRHTDAQRTQASAEKFAEGLFGSSTGVYIPEALKNDTLIQSYANCPAWKATVDDNPHATIEVTRFQEGAQMDLLIQNVSSRLGFGHKLKFKDISIMYDMCRCNKAWRVSERSAWCAVFSKEELKLLEYMEDIKYYYKRGYGHNINVDLGCPPVKDLMDRFSKLEGENVVRGQQPVGFFYFSHSSMLHMVQSRLGVYKDSQPLLSSNYDLMQKRQWRVSKIGSFASNIAAVFFKCTEGDKNRVMFYQSESSMDIEGCKVGLCSWDVVKEKFSTIAQECNLNFCDMNRSGAEKTYYFTSWFVVVFTAISVSLSFWL